MTVKQVSNGNPDGSTLGQDDADKISFHGATPVVRQTVTGSRGGNAALASLLTALDAIGAIIDNTTA